jgi:hypothetical protein
MWHSAAAPVKVFVSRALQSHSAPGKLYVSRLREGGNLPLVAQISG